MPHPFARRTFDTLKKDAKRWLAAIAAGDAAARARFARALPNGAVHTDAARRAARARPRAGLRRLDGAEAGARARSRRQRRHARPATTRWPTPCSRRIAPARRRRWSATTLHVASTGLVRPCAPTSSSISASGPTEPGGDVAITLDDARYLVARERGFENWDALARVGRATCLAARRTSRRSPRPRRSGCGSCWNAATRRRSICRGVREVTDAHLAAIGRLSRLERLNLSGTSITDAGVAHLRGCDALRDGEPGGDLHRRRRAPCPGRHAASAQLPERVRRHRRRHRRCSTSGRCSRRGTAARRRSTCSAGTPSRTS